MGQVTLEEIEAAVAAGEMSIDALWGLISGKFNTLTDFGQWTLSKLNDNVIGALGELYQGIYGDLENFGNGLAEQADRNATWIASVYATWMGELNESIDHNSDMIGSIRDDLSDSITRNSQSLQTGLGKKIDSLSLDLYRGITQQANSFNTSLNRLAGTVYNSINALTPAILEGVGEIVEAAFPSLKKVEDALSAIADAMAFFAAIPEALKSITLESIISQSASLLETLANKMKPFVPGGSE